MLSETGWQSVTYHCRYSLAWKDNKGSDAFSIKLKGDNDVEYEASSPRKLRPSILVDECKVMLFSFFNLTPRLHAGDNDWLFMM